MSYVMSLRQIANALDRWAFVKNVQVELERIEEFKKAG